jgi:hypothetical protein
MKKYYGFEGELFNGSNLVFIKGNIAVGCCHRCEKYRKVYYTSAEDRNKAQNVSFGSAWENLMP